ncbi:hypothetical protein ACOME3_005207 [Neoechinorhynchus agilis]
MKKSSLKPWELLEAIRIRTTSHGAQFVDGTLIGFDKSDQVDLHGNRSFALKEALVLDTDNNIHPILFAKLIIAAGSASSKVAEMCGMGCEPEYPAMSIPLPIAPLKRHVFTAYGNGSMCICVDNPIVVDPSGAFFVKTAASNHIICGEPMPSTQLGLSWDRDVNPLAWNRTKEIVKRRIIGLNQLVLRSTRVGLVDYNVYDETWILGSHPYLNNVFFACGSSGNGIQHALGIGKANYELQSAGCYRTINLDRLSVNRIANDTPLKENFVF